MRQKELEMKQKLILNKIKSKERRHKEILQSDLLKNLLNKKKKVNTDTDSE